MKPVFVSETGGRLYQTGYRQLNKMPITKREFLTRDVSLGIAVSPLTIPMPFKQTHHPFGDNRQWDGPTPQLQDWIETGANILKAGGSVMVYCFYGRNRSGLIATLIVRQYAGVSGAEALRLVRRSRKGSVGGNPHFVRYLEGLEAP